MMSQIQERFAVEDDEILADQMLVLKNPLGEHTVKQKRFIQAFDGNPTRAAKIAGYKNPSATGAALLKIPSIIEAIKLYQTTRKEAKDLRSTKEEREIFLTLLSRNIDPDRKNELDPVTGAEITDEHHNIDLKDRMKAVEMLGKMNGDFVEKIALDASTSLSDLILAARKVTKSVEEIEAEYEAERLRAIEEKEAIPDAEIVEPKTVNALEGLI